MRKFTGKVKVAGENNSSEKYFPKTQLVRFIVCGLSTFVGRLLNKIRFSFSRAIK
ncbi:hypothetical protein GCM10028817_07330 [Spirosoma pomorum]